MSFANAEAMRLAGLKASTPNPVGGEILKDAQGKPIGIFRETAQELVRRGQSANSQKPEENARNLQKSIDLAQEVCLANGVTSFQDAGSGSG
jgi:predicted amidohydrolase YtcJ